MMFFRKRRTGADHIATGISGEDEAARFLATRGFSFVARNWRPTGKARNLELDVVGRWESFLVFVEVKTRRPGTRETEDYPAAIHNFSPAKQRNMIRAVRAYLTEHGAWNEPCRFDLVCVTLLSGQQPQVEHYRNVIELGQTVDSRDASWQPW